MCFSATAGFVSGTALSAIGISTIRKVKSRAELPLAVTPLLFGAQQIAEGVIWLSFGWPSSIVTSLLPYLYLFFAYLLWPIWGPFVISQLESTSWRKKTLYGLQLVGILASAGSLYFLVQNPATCQVVGNHIIYSTPPAYAFVVIVVLYLAATCGSCLISSNRLIQLGGALGCIAFLIAYYLYATAFVSVWCFFAAVVSLMIGWYFYRRPLT